MIPTSRKKLIPKNLQIQPSLELGNMGLNIEPAAINDLVSDVVNSWNSRMPEGFFINQGVDPTCGEVCCNSTRIIQILNNLIDNAVKFSPDGGFVGVTTIAVSDEVWISVRDEGVGVKLKEKETIFEKVHPLKIEYKRCIGALGIKLPLARELIELHGGRIWVDIEEKGSTFTFSLPRIRKIAQTILELDGSEGVLRKK